MRSLRPLFRPSSAIFTMASVPTARRLGKLDADNLPESLVKAEYAVRGRIVARAQVLAAELAAGRPHPFSEIIYCNIGNPHQLNQKPLSFPRRVLAACADPSLLQKDVYPADVVERARSILAEAKSIGSYSPSQGLKSVREHVAAYITKRDGGISAVPENIWLYDGASMAVKAAFELLLSGPSDGLMIPIPQYPLYSALLTLTGAAPVRYFLDESAGWELSIPELERAFNDAVAQGVTPRGLVVINPGNPTGAVLSDENVAAIAQWAAGKGIALLADEVYQANVYTDGRKFKSFKSAVVEADLADKLDLFSFHSASKGFGGECGLRGGYMEALNLSPAATEQLMKIGSLNLGSNIPGQIVFSCILDPPVGDSPSAAEHAAETDAIFQSLRRRCRTLVDCMNTVPGVSCAPVDGAMYVFPSIQLPAKAVEAAALAKIAPDELYCLELLENTGICVVPGSGFGQRDGTFHFRTTFLPQEERIEKVADLFRNFHVGFTSKYL